MPIPLSCPASSLGHPWRWPRPQPACTAVFQTLGGDRRVLSFPTARPPGSGAAELAINLTPCQGRERFGCGCGGEGEQWWAQEWALAYLRGCWWDWGVRHGFKEPSRLPEGIASFLHLQAVGRHGGSCLLSKATLRACKGELQGKSSGNMDTHPALGLVAWVRKGFAFAFFPEGLSLRRWKPGEHADSGQKLEMLRDSRAGGSSAVASPSCQKGQIPALAQLW